MPSQSTVKAFTYCDIQGSNRSAFKDRLVRLIEKIRLTRILKQITSASESRLSVIIALVGPFTCFASLGKGVAMTHDAIVDVADAFIRVFAVQTGLKLSACAL